MPADRLSASSEDRGIVVDWWTSLLKVGFTDGWAFTGALVLLIVVGAFREWWVPGPVHRRAVEAAKTAAASLETALQAVSKLVESQRIVDYFFENVLPGKSTGRMPPKRGTVEPEPARGERDY